MTREIAVRLLRILFAYAVSVLAGAFALALYTILSGIDEYRATLWSSILLVSLKGTLILSVFGGFPAVCAVALGEYRQIKAWVFYLAAGALIGAAFSAVAIPEGKFPWQGPVTGMIVGLIYWRLGGWRAGWPGQDGKSDARRALAIALLLIGVIVLLAAMVTFVFVRPYGR